MTNNPTDSDPSTLTFVHRFSTAVQCTMRVRDQAPEHGSGLNLNFEWSGRPKPKHLGDYRRWVLATAQILADRWDSRILYALGTAADSTELWTFEPGKAPRLVKKLNAGIP